MRRVLLAVALACLAACHHGTAAGPAWPAASTTADDGGESLAPKPSAGYAAAIESAKDETGEKPAAAAAPAAEGAATEDKPATTPAASQPASEDVFQTEDMIIEIDE